MPLEKAKVEKAREAKATKARAKEESPVIITTTVSTEAHTRETKGKARERAKIVTNADMKATWPKTAKWNIHFKECAMTVGSGGIKPKNAGKDRWCERSG